MSTPPSPPECSTRSKPSTPRCSPCSTTLYAALPSSNPPPLPHLLLPHASTGTSPPHCRSKSSPSLDKSLLSVPAAPPPPPKTQQPAPQPTKARPPKSAPARSPATAAPAIAAHGVTPVSHKRQRKTLLPQPQLIAERMLIFQLSRPPTVDAATAATNPLRTINKAITEHPDVAHPPCLTASITASNTLVVVVSDRHRATEYTPYLGILQEALRKAEVPVTGACVSEKWTQFILSNVPTTATFDEISREVEMLYLEMRLGQSPRWRTTAEQRAGKDASSVVLTVVGQQTTKSIGRSQLYLSNRRCFLKEYVMFGPTLAAASVSSMATPPPDAPLVSRPAPCAPSPTSPNTIRATSRRARRVPLVPTRQFSASLAEDLTTPSIPSVQLTSRSPLGQREGSGDQYDRGVGRPFVVSFRFYGYLSLGN
jgi:hypothetical protein